MVFVCHFQIFHFELSSRIGRADDRIDEALARLGGSIIFIIIAVISLRALIASDLQLH
jgi:hypothetical protein